MTDDEALKKYDELVKRFGDKIPNPTQYPKIFAYYVKLYKYYEFKENTEDEQL